MTTNTSAELQILRKKETFLWERLDEAVEFTENTNSLNFLTKELDRIKARILELETQEYFKELDQQYENAN